MPNECHKIANIINTCNCDARDPVERQDSGFINNMVSVYQYEEMQLGTWITIGFKIFMNETLIFQADLPITGFNYGFMEYDMQKASIKIGPLECTGKFRYGNS